MTPSAPVSAARIRARQPADLATVAAFLERHHSARVARLDELQRPLDHPALVAVDGDDLVGVQTYVLAGTAAEILTLHVDERWRGAGTGTALIGSAERLAVGAGCTRLFLVTTNDNTAALRFYQRRGFRLAELRPGAVTRSRATLKPEIPELGTDGIAIRDELVLDKPLIPDSR